MKARTITQRVAVASSSALAIACGHLLGYDELSFEDRDGAAGSATKDGGGAGKMDGGGANGSDASGNGGVAGAVGNGGDGGSGNSGADAAGGGGGAQTGGAGGTGATTSGVCAAFDNRCAGRACGDDGFNGSCGTCAAGTRCSLDGACVACTANCTGKVCGDDGCNGSCGSCPNGKSCTAHGECDYGTLMDSDELHSIYYINEFRTTAQKWDSSGKLVLASFPRPTACTTKPELNVAVPPVRLNADMVRNSRLNAQHVVQYMIANNVGFCGHSDPIDGVGALGDRLNGFLGSQGCQNAWCGYVAPPDTPITTDPFHCECMLYPGETDWGLGHVLSKVFTSSAGQNGYQFQDPASDAAFLPVIIENEAVSTTSPSVNVYVPEQGSTGDSVTNVGKITDVELSEDPCFTGASWQPWSSSLSYSLSSGNGRKVLYGRVRDANGVTAVSWDSIFLGPEPAAFDTLKEGINRIRSVRVPPLSKTGYDAFQYSLNWHIEAEKFGPLWGSHELIDDADASGGKAYKLTTGSDGLNGAVWTFPSDLGVLDAEAYFRLKTADNTGTATRASCNVREDGGGSWSVDVVANQFTAKNVYQWFKVGFKRASKGKWLFFQCDGLGSVGVTFDRVDIYSKPVSMPTNGTTIDFSNINNRGIEMQTRYVNTASGAFADGPRINPYCSPCATP